MKKILSYMLALAICFSVVLTVSASDATVTVTAKYSAETDAIEISGVLNTDKGNVTLALKILAPDGETVYNDQLTVLFDENANNKYSYSFNPIKFSNAHNSGIYTIEVSGLYLLKKASTIYEHTGIDTYYNIVAGINTAIKNKDTTNLLNAFNTNHARIGIDISLLTGLKENGLKEFNRIMLGKSYSLPENYISDEAVQEIKQQVKKLASDYNLAVFIGEKADLSTSDELLKWLEKNKGYFSEEASETSVSEAELYKYVEYMKNEESFVKRFLSPKEFSKKEEIRATLYEDSILSVIETKHYSEGSAILQKYPELFFIDTDKLSKLDTIQRADVYEKAAGNNYSSYKDVGDAVNRLIDSCLNRKPGSGGGSGGGSVKGLGASLKVAANTDTVNIPEVVFNDLDKVPWAREAIEYLAEKKIVSGRGDGGFSPDDFITRSEFVKLVIVSLGMDASKTDSSFEDVPENSWYAPYVSAAEKLGIIKGNDKKQFMPDNLITRQDMAVIIYRAYIGEGEVFDMSFQDADLISDYAVNAVSALAKKGIINGMGNNTFAPKLNSTRAQVAKIIYTIVR